MTVADALPNIDFVMSLVLPVDVPQMVADRFQMEVMLNYTTKPIIFVTTEFSGCVDAVAGAMLGRVLKQMKYGTSVAAIGLAGGAAIEGALITPGAWPPPAPPPGSPPRAAGSRRP